MLGPCFPREASAGSVLEFAVAPQKVCTENGSNPVESGSIPEIPTNSLTARSSAEQSTDRMPNDAGSNPAAPSEFERIEMQTELKPFSIIDQDRWDTTVAVNNDSGYGRAVMVYAAQWANLMEERINRGEELKDIADQTSHLADTVGITGFMYGYAVSILAKVWKHGEELRRWHNLNTQIGNEGEKANESGGVLNPAILTIG